MTLDIFTDIVAWTGFPFGMFVIGMSLISIVFFIRNRHKYTLHIVLMALSYTKAIVLLVLTINYRIFFDGLPRFVGAIVLLLLFVEGAVGLWLIFERRKQSLIHRTES